MWAAIDWSVVGPIVTAIVLAAGAVDRFWQKRVNAKNANMEEVLGEMKAELTAHITANRIQSDRFTRRSVEALATKVEESNEVLLVMMSDLEDKVTKKADTKRVRVTAPEKVGV
jgi:hypothetical protein